MQARSSGQLTAVDTKVFDVPDDLTDDDLLETCLPRFRWMSQPTICGAYAPGNRALEFTERIDTTAVRGEPTGDRPGFPVVLRGDVACEDVTLDVGFAADQLREWDAAALSAFNRARQVEGQLSSAADDGCLDVDAARNLALDARDQLDGDWPVVETVPGAEDDEHAGLCFDVRLDRHGVVRVDYHAGPNRPNW